MTENQITFQIRGAIFDIYNELRPGLLESVYEKAMVYELRSRGLKEESQVEVPLMYKGQVLGNDLRVDLLVENKVIVELKSVEEMKKVFFKQLMTYLRITNLRVGILVNFNTDQIDHSIHRLINGY